MAMVVIMIVMIMVMIVMIMPVMVMAMMIMLMMIMPVMIMPLMAVRGVCFGGIGTALWLKGCLDGAQLGAQGLKRRLEALIGPNTQRGFGDFNRHMAIADMPGQPRQNLRISGANLDEHLGRSHHFDQPAVFQFKRVAAAQMHRLRQIQQKLQTACPHHMQAAMMPVLGIQQHAVSRLYLPTAPPLHFGGAWHARMVIGHGEAPKTTWRARGRDAQRHQ